MQCEKTVFIGKSSDVRLEYEFLSRKYTDIKFFRSSQTLEPYPIGILFQHGWKSKIVERFKRVSEAGILTLILKEDLSRVNSNRAPAIVFNKTKGFKPINIASLEGKWSTIFILSGSIICLACVVLLIECRFYVGRVIVKIYALILFRHYKNSRTEAADKIIRIAVAVTELGKK